MNYPSLQECKMPRTTCGSTLNRKKIAPHKINNNVNHIIPLTCISFKAVIS